MAPVLGLLGKMKQDWWKVIAVLGRPGGAAIQTGMQTTDSPPVFSVHDDAEEHPSGRTWKAHGGGRT